MQYRGHWELGVGGWGEWGGGLGNDLYCINNETFQQIKCINLATLLYMHYQKNVNCFVVIDCMHMFIIAVSVP